MTALRQIELFSESEPDSPAPAGAPGVEESGLRRLPEAPEPELLLSDLPDLSELLEPVPTATPRPGSTPPPIPPPRRRSAPPPEPLDFSDVLSWYRPRIAAQGEEVARVSIPPGLIVSPTTEDEPEPWEPGVGQVVLAATLVFGLVWAAVSLLG